jgi:enoyl-CoA hydratase
VTAPSPTPLIVEELGGGVVHLRLNRPERFNTLEAGLVTELHTALDRIAEDGAVRVVVLSGRGKHFCAGADLAGHGLAPGGDGSGSPQDWMSVQQHIASLVLKLRALPQPVVAAVNGAASGGGMALALASDVCLGATDARFNVAFVKIGLSGCDIGVSWLLPRVVGSRRAFELLLTGRFVEAAEAAAIGLVTRVVEPGGLLDAAVEQARTIAANSPYGVRMTKEVMWSQLEIGSLRAGLDLENRTQVTAVLTQDHREGIQAFLEKRPPRFENR